MKKIAAYKAYLLYEVTERDISALGGTGESRYIRGRVLVFHPQTKPISIGGELWTASNLEEATTLIDENDQQDICKMPLQEVINSARKRSRNRALQAINPKGDKQSISLSGVSDPLRNGRNG